MSNRYAEWRLELRGLNLSQLESEWGRLKNELDRLKFAYPTTHELTKAYAEEELKATEDAIADVKRHMALEERESK